MISHDASTVPANAAGAADVCHVFLTGLFVLFSSPRPGDAQMIPHAAPWSGAEEAGRQALAAMLTEFVE